MASYRKDGIKWDRKNWDGIDADCAKGLTSYIVSRENVLNTFTTSVFSYVDGPFSGQQVELCDQSPGMLPLDFNGWVGYYDNGKWHGTTGKPLFIPEQSGELAKNKDAGKLGKGYECLGDLLSQLAEDPKDHEELTTVYKSGIAVYGAVDDFGNAMPVHATPGIYDFVTPYYGIRLGEDIPVTAWRSDVENIGYRMHKHYRVDDFGELFHVATDAVHMTEHFSYKIRALKAVYTIGTTTYKINATAQSVDSLRAKVLLKKRFFADKYTLPSAPELGAVNATNKATISIEDMARQDVAQVVATAQSAAAIERAQLPTPTIDQAPWQMTRAAYTGQQPPAYREAVGNAHMQSVARAIQSGKSVPADVLVDYPEFAIVAAFNTRIKPDYTRSVAKYAKGMIAIRALGKDWFKSRAERLAETFGNRYSNREHAHIMTPGQADKFEQLYAAGWDANYMQSGAAARQAPEQADAVAADDARELVTADCEAESDGITCELSGSVAAHFGQVGSASGGVSVPVQNLGGHDAAGQSSGQFKTKTGGVSGDLAEPDGQGPGEQSSGQFKSKTDDGCSDLPLPRWQSYAGDIPASLAISAYQGVSMSPERRGASAQNEFAQSLAEDYAELHAQAVKGKTLDLLLDVFARYRARQASTYRAYLASSSRCVSSFIAGPSNFPAARMNKRADIAHRRLNDYLDGGTMAKRAAIRTLRPDLRAIMAGDADAQDRLAAKIANAERLQERMKSANKAIRINAKAGAARQVEALMQLGFTEGNALELIKPDFCGRIGFASYQLTNNNANIRRMVERLEQISKAQACDVVSVECASGITFEDDAPANRVRLFFPGKPAESVRSELKGAGFRWAPSLGAWQAYRNHGTISTARRMAGEAVETSPAEATDATPEGAEAPEVATVCEPVQSQAEQAGAVESSGQLESKIEGVSGELPEQLGQDVAPVSSGQFETVAPAPAVEKPAAPAKTSKPIARAWVPDGGQRVRAKSGAWEAWTYIHDKTGKHCFVMYRGKSAKRWKWFHYADRAQMVKALSYWAQKAQELHDAAARRAAEVKAKAQEPHGMQVGDVVLSSWGYDQTNADHYQIVAVIGNRTVEVRKLAQDREYSGDMSGTCTPIHGDFVGEVMRRQVDRRGAVNVMGRDYGRARKIEPLTVVVGVPCYPRTGWSSYA